MPGEKSPVVPGATHETELPAPLPAACGNCRHFHDPAAADPQKYAAMIQARGFARPGMCRRFPTYVPRAADDRCGEHHRVQPR
jgi:hypothetical protein